MILFKLLNVFGLVFGLELVVLVMLCIYVMIKYYKKYLVGNKYFYKVYIVDFFKNLVGSVIMKFLYFFKSGLLIIWK